jgi:hypothetical protein
MEIPKLPVVIDPETGEPEVVGKGRTAIIKAGSATVSRLVQLTETGTPREKFNPIDELVASGALRNN